MRRARFHPPEALPEAAFGQRMTMACDNREGCPPLHRGRLGWIVDGFKKHFKEAISAESVRKWLGGKGRPRPRRLAMLAELLKVDEAWLAIGGDADPSADQRKARNAMADGGVNLIAGLIALHGGHVAFPDPGSRLGQDADIIAVIKGAAYNFNVSLGLPTGSKSYTFRLPTGYRDVIVLGLVEVGPLQWHLLEFDADLISKHKQNRGSHLEVTVDRRGSSYSTGGDRVQQLSGFRERP
jgi:hypothetical protein